MNERERILDLVKQGVLTSEEALVLLENLAKANTDGGSKPAAPAVSPTDADADDDAEQQPDHDADAALTELNTRIATASGSLDAVNAQLSQIAHQIAANDEQIIVLDTMEDLDTLSAEKYEERGQLKRENQTLAARQEELTAQQGKLKDELADLQRQRRRLTKSGFSSVFGEDWQNSAKGTLNDLGKTVGDAASQVGSIVKQTVDTVMDNIDWKDVTVRVPGVATEKFSHTFEFEGAATIIDVKVANGDVTFASWDQPGFKVDANIKLFGKMPEATPLAAFEARSHIEVNDAHFVFQVPNRRVQADLTIYLPKREYDHLSARLLNGSVTFTDVSGKDFYVKSTNGELTVTGLTATMLETEGVNGSIKVTGGNIHDLLLHTVNGDIKVNATPQTLDLQTVNGTIRTTLLSDFQTLTASSVNGNVKVALPASVAVSGEAKTRFGSVKSRMTGVTSEKDHKHLSLDRPGTGSGVINVATTSGTIQLKDVDPE